MKTKLDELMLDVNHARKCLDEVIESLKTNRNPDYIAKCKQLMPEIIDRVNSRNYLYKVETSSYVKKLNKTLYNEEVISATGGAMGWKLKTITMKDLYEGLTYNEKCQMDAMRISEYQPKKEIIKPEDYIYFEI